MVNHKTLTLRPHTFLVAQSVQKQMWGGGLLPEVRCTGVLGKRVYYELSVGSRGWELWEVWEEPACPVNKSVFNWQVPSCAGLLCKIKEPVSSSSVLRLGLSLPALTYSIYTWLVGTWLLLWKPHLSLSLFLSFSFPPSLNLQQR